MTAVDTDDFDPHTLAEQDFLDEVHSFQFWFDSIEGYLTDRPYGRLETTDEEPIDHGRVGDRTSCAAGAGRLQGAAAELVTRGDWQAAVFAQNVILETMEYTVFWLHAANADAVTRDVCSV